MKDVQKGTTNSVEEPSVLKESPATALVDGNNLLGPVVGNFCMKLAIQKAKEVGIGLVVAKRSTHYGKHRQLFRNYFLAKMKKLQPFILDCMNCVIQAIRPVRMGTPENFSGHF